MLGVYCLFRLISKFIMYWNFFCLFCVKIFVIYVNELFDLKYIYVFGWFFVEFVYELYLNCKVFGNFFFDWKCVYFFEIIKLMVYWLLEFNVLGI